MARAITDPIAAAPVDAELAAMRKRLDDLAARIDLLRADFERLQQVAQPEEVRL